MNEKNSLVVCKTEEANHHWFQKLGVPSIIYSILYTLFMYDNPSGITKPLWILTTLFYIGYVMRQMGMIVKRDSIFYMAVMILLGISSVFTGNGYIIMMNYVGLFLMLLVLLLHNFYEDTKWQLGKGIQMMIRAVLGAIGYLCAPFQDLRAYQKEKDNQKESRNHAIGWGIFVALPCVLLLGALLVSADAVFKELMGSIIGGIKISSQIFWIMMMLAFGFLSSYCGMRCLGSKRNLNDENTVDKMDTRIAITFTSCITTLYLVFCTVQIRYLFFGGGSLPEGMTYASYARQGFFQLLFVGILNFIMVVILKTYFEKSKWLDILLYLLCGCTFVMIVSSGWRMGLYIQAYGLTFLRIGVYVALAILICLMVGVVLLICRKEFPLYRYTIIVISSIYLLFSFSHVDYFIASYNLSNIDRGLEEHDKYYLSSLSTDAAPAIVGYAKEHPKALWATEYLDYHAASVRDNGVRNFNVSRYMAQKSFKEIYS